MIKSCLIKSLFVLDVGCIAPRGMRGHQLLSMNGNLLDLSLSIISLCVKINTLNFMDAFPGMVSKRDFKLLTSYLEQKY